MMNDFFFLVAGVGGGGHVQFPKATVTISRVFHKDLDKLLLTDLAVSVQVELVDHRLAENRSASVQVSRKEECATYSSLSSSCSPSSLDTRRSSLNPILPLLSASKRAKAR